MTVDAHMNSVVYTMTDPAIGEHTYLITYTVDTNAYAKFGHNSAEIYKQIENADMDYARYGITMTGTCGGVNGSYFITKAFVGDGIVCYPLPPLTAPLTGLIIPMGAIGFGSMLQ
jgi:hypothetical protein